MKIKAFGYCFLLCFINLTLLFTGPKDVNLKLVDETDEQLSEKTPVVAGTEAKAISIIEAIKIPVFINV